MCVLSSKFIQKSMASKDMYPELISRKARQSAATLLLILVAALLTPSAAYAEWTGGITGGAVIRNGDRSNRIRLTAQNPSRPFTQLVYLDYIINDGEDSFELGYRPRYFITDSFYGLLELSARTDDPIGINRETTEALGIGYQFLQTQTSSAYVEIAAGARQISFTNTLIEDTNEPFTRLRANYSQLISDVGRFNFDLSGRASEVATESSAEVSFTLNLANFSVTLGYRVINQNISGQPSFTDDTTTFSFGYSVF